MAELSKLWCPKWKIEVCSLSFGDSAWIRQGGSKVFKQALLFLRSGWSPELRPVKKIKFKCVLFNLITGICLHSRHFSAVKETSISESEFRWADCLCGWELELSDLSSSFPKIHYSVPIEKNSTDTKKQLQLLFGYIPSQFSFLMYRLLHTVYMKSYSIYTFHHFLHYKTNSMLLFILIIIFSDIH